jgi:formylglycine-generating enzyme required for sulfatase activity
MNTNLLHIVKQITARYGEAVLADPARLKAFFGDLAKDEPKPLRLAFGRCIEEGAYNALKTAPDAAERAERKAAIAQRLRDEHGLDMALCGEALDVLEAALYGVQSTAPPSKPPIQQPQYTPPYASPQPSTTPAAANTIPKTKKKFPIAALIAVTAVAALIWYFSQHSMSNNQQSASNVNHPSSQQPAPVQPVPANMVRINGGTFMMGSPASEPMRWNSEGPQHSVTVSSFYMGNYEITQREWREVMGNNPSYFKGDDLPVEQVSWYDAVEYCRSSPLK